MWQNRTQSLIGQQRIEKLSKSKIAVIGIGGVGGHASDMLARAGVGNITIVDFDVVDITNINRQIVATHETIGKPKTEVMREMIKSVNPTCNVAEINEKVCSGNLDKIFKNQNFDFVIDAIDSIDDKVDLICYCKNNNLNIISAMGAGNRLGIPHFEVLDIYKTENDGLAKIMRKRLRERGITKLNVVSTKEPALKPTKDNNSNGERLIGSISYYPAMCGCVLSAYVLNALLNTEHQGI